MARKYSEYKQWDERQCPPRHTVLSDILVWLDCPIALTQYKSSFILSAFVNINVIVIEPMMAKIIFTTLSERWHVGNNTKKKQWPALIPQKEKISIVFLLLDAPPSTVRANILTYFTANILHSFLPPFFQYIFLQTIFNIFVPLFLQGAEGGSCSFFSSFSPHNSPMR